MSLSILFRHVRLHATVPLTLHCQFAGLLYSVAEVFSRIVYRVMVLGSRAAHSTNVISPHTAWALPLGGYQSHQPHKSDSLPLQDSRARSDQHTWPAE